MKYRKNFGELPRYHKALGEIDSTFKDAGDNLINAVRVDYDPKTGKITPKIDLKELQKQIIKSVVDKVKQEIKNRIQSEIIKQMSTQIAAMYAKYVVPGLQVVGAIEFALKSKKTLKQVFDLAFALYGQKLSDFVFHTITGGYFKYKESYHTYTDAAQKLFNPKTPSNAQYGGNKVPGYAEQYKIFESRKLKVSPSLIMLQYYPYYAGEKLLIDIVNDLFPELKTYDKEVRINMADDLALYLRNGVEDPISTYLYSEDKMLEDGKIEISVSSELQEELDKAIVIYMGDDIDFRYQITFMTNSLDNVPPEFKNKNYTTSFYPQGTLMPGLFEPVPSKRPEKHQAQFLFNSAYYAPEEIKNIARKMNEGLEKHTELIALGQKDKKIKRYIFIKKNDDGTFEELPESNYEYLYSHPNAPEKRIELDFDKLPSNVYVIYDRRVIHSYSPKSNKDYWTVKIDTTRSSVAASREDTILQVATNKLLEKAVDVTAIDPVEEYNLFIAEANKPKETPTQVSTTPLKKGSPSNPLTSSVMLRSVSYKKDGGRIRYLLQNMDSTTAEIFMKTIQSYPYPFKGLSHDFYFNRINKKVEAQLAAIRKKNQRIGLGVAGLAVLGYLATQD